MRRLGKDYRTVVAEERFRTSGWGTSTNSVPPRGADYHVSEREIVTPHPPLSLENFLKPLRKILKVAKARTLLETSAKENSMHTIIHTSLRLAFTLQQLI